MVRYDERGEGEGEGDLDEQVSGPSRYRSLRQRTTSASTTSNTKGITGGNRELDQPLEHAVSNSISRTMSRYRRRAPSNAGGTGNTVTRTTDADASNIPPLPANPVLQNIPNSPPTTGDQAVLAPEPSARRQLHYSEAQRGARDVPIEPMDDRTDQSNKQCDRKRGLIMLADRNARRPSLGHRDFSWEVDRDRLLEEQKKRDLQRLEEELENCKRPRAQPHKRRSPVVEKLVLLAKGGKSRSNKDEASPMSPVSPKSPKSPKLPKSPKSPKSPISPTALLMRTRTLRSGPEAARSPAAYIEPGGKGIVPQKDAPTSAINSGDRNVTVRWQNHTFSLPVTPETTASDIIVQTSSRMRHHGDIDPEKCLVIERYGVLGLERRLRRYERIRDVMNSWDRDTQNQLIVMMPDPSDNHEDLEASAVAESGDSPSGCQLYMYHSNRPGKWNKRWITLLESGQILCAKKPNAKTAHKDTASLCHLSDYDIYTPTEVQIKKHIKPPKRLCFAIKSQHKTTLFLNTENYVQYFCLEDPQEASEFKQKVHNWRSWYLFDRRPEVGHNQNVPITRIEAGASAPQAVKPAPKQCDDVGSVDGLPQESLDEPPYPIGQFKPLLDMKRFDKPFSEFGEELLPLELSPTKQKEDQGILRRFSRKGKSDHKPSRFVIDTNEAFTGGLLGDGYEQRKQALADLEKNKGSRELACTNGSSQPKSQRDLETLTESSDSPSWFPSAMEHTAKKRVMAQTIAMQRTLSIGHGQHSYSNTHTQAHPNPPRSQLAYAPTIERRGAQKPLVDLTPTVQEPPQWSQEKKGHGVKPPEGQGHLVDFISASNGNGGKSGRHFEPPPRSLPRQALAGTAPLGRTRSMSSSSTSRRPIFDDAPPIPTAPQGVDLATSSNGRRFASAPVTDDGRLGRRATVRDRDREPMGNDGRLGRQATVRDRDREYEKTRVRGREREHRQREYREREAAYNAVPGRTGTLKVV